MGVWHFWIFTHFHPFPPLFTLFCSSPPWTSTLWCGPLSWGDGGKEWDLHDEEVAALYLRGAASPNEVEETLPDKKAEEMAKEGFYLVKSVLRHYYCKGWHFLTLWERYGVDEATRESCLAFLLPDGRLNSVVVEYLFQDNLGELLRLAELLAEKA